MLVDTSIIPHQALKMELLADVEVVPAMVVVVLEQVKLLVVEHLVVKVQVMVVSVASLAEVEVVMDKQDKML